MSAWIDVGKKLPIEKGYYLVCIERIAPEDLGGSSRRIKILRWTNEGLRMPTHFPKWIINEITEYVTHWQFLPALPREYNDRHCPHGYRDWDECPVCCH